MSRPILISGLMIATMATFALAAPASAKSATQIRQEAIEKREAAQVEAISKGRHDGSLTWWEKYRLVREQRRIEKLDAQVRADGKITKSEYYDVKRAQNDARDHIGQDQHNQYVRGWWWRTFVR
jgi:lipopolysaccharide export LptBFGC system permease protein LptF